MKNCPLGGNLLVGIFPHQSGLAMQVKLIVVSGRVNRTEVQLTLPAVLGRSREADLTLGHPSISRQHCRLVEQNGVVVVQDLDSTNGTFVEDQRVEEAVLEPGARLRIGPLTFVVVYDRPRTPSQPDEPELPWVVEAEESLPSDNPTPPVVDASAGSGLVGQIEPSLQEATSPSQPEEKEPDWDQIVAQAAPAAAESPPPTLPPEADSASSESSTSEDDDPWQRLLNELK